MTRNHSPPRQPAGNRLRSPIPAHPAMFHSRRLRSGGNVKQGHSPLRQIVGACGRLASEDVRQTLDEIGAGVRLAGDGR